MLNSITKIEIRSPLLVKEKLTEDEYENVMKRAEHIGKMKIGADLSSLVYEFADIAVRKRQLKEILDSKQISEDHFFVLNKKEEYNEELEQSTFYDDLVELTIFVTPNMESLLNENSLTPNDVFSLGMAYAELKNWNQFNFKEVDGLYESSHMINRE